MSVCPNCHGKGLVKVTTSKSAVDWDTFLIFGWEKPCDYPGCHGGVVSCSEAPVNRWEKGTDVQPSPAQASPHE